MITFWPIIVSILILLIALALGLYIRHLLLKQFKKASLSLQLAHAVGIIAIVLLLILAIYLGVAIVTGNIDLFAALSGSLGTKPTALQSLADLLWKVTITGLLLLIGLVIAAQLRETINRRLEEQEVAVNLRTLIGRACYVLVLLAALFVDLLIWDVQIALPVAIVSGVLTFALRDLIKDLVSGVFILADHPFQIGDQVTITSQTGTVTNISIRTSTMRLVTGEEMVVPNGRFIDQNVSNNTRYKSRRAAIDVVFAEEAYAGEETQKQMIETIKGTAIASAEQEPTITLNAAIGRVKGYNEERDGNENKTIELSVRFWVESRNRYAVTEVMEALCAAFPHADFRVTEFAGNI
jgi:small-conductance mechanosensitive channel